MSVRAREVKGLKKKSGEFLEGGKRALDAGQFDLSCFLYEQSLQLFLKADLLAKAGDFPRTHSLRELLGEFREGVPQVGSFVRRNRARISSLEDAYVLARYSGKEYSKEDAADAARLCDEVMRLVGGDKRAGTKVRPRGGGGA